MYNKETMKLLPNKSILFATLLFTLSASHVDAQSVASQDYDSQVPVGHFFNTTVINNSDERISFPICHVADGEVYERPTLVTSATVVVTDRNSNGFTDEQDIQYYIDKANAEWRKSPSRQMIRVALAQDDLPTRLQTTVTLRSGVLLDGNGQSVIAHQNFTGNNGSLFISAPNSKHVGLYNMRMFSNESVSRALFDIRAGSSYVYVYNNEFADESDLDHETISGRVNRLRAVSLASNVSHVYIDNNFFFRINTGVSAIGNKVSNLYVTYNRFQKWRSHGVNVITQTDRSSNIYVLNNLFGIPLKGTIKRPIAIQKIDGSPGSKNVHIKNNTIFGTGDPHIHEAKDSNRATADMIALARVDGFVVSHNCVHRAGEAGIAIIRGSKNGTVKNNYLNNVDLVAIYAGSRHNDGIIENVVIRDNIVIDAVRNKANHGGGRDEWGRAAISIDNSVGVKIIENTIKENEFSYYDKDNSNIRTMYWGIYVDDTSHETTVVRNEFEMEDHVIPVHLP